VYDLVVCADVFIYLGRLDDILKGLAARMADRGYLLFSTEDGPDPGRYSLLPSGRYGHCPFYVQSLASENGFLVRQCLAAPIRKEGHLRLQGNLFVLEKMKA
jgi:predicted TPR repeat methyltransferase